MSFKLCDAAAVCAALGTALVAYAAPALSAVAPVNPPAASNNDLNLPYVEDLYGYRYIERVLVDRVHSGTSADLGVHALGKFDNGMFDYQLSVINGGGYHDIKRSKTVDVSARFGFHPNKNAYYSEIGIFAQYAF